MRTAIPQRMSIRPANPDNARVQQKCTRQKVTKSRKEMRTKKASCSWSMFDARMKQSIIKVECFVLDAFRA